jgi:hypothetical protein
MAQQVDGQAPVPGMERLTRMPPQVAAEAGDVFSAVVLVKAFRLASHGLLPRLWPPTDGDPKDRLSVHLYGPTFGVSIGLVAEGCVQPG